MTVTFNKALHPRGRVRAGDQFTVEIRNAAGTVLNAATQSTTVGAGAAVTAGSGTTGPTTVAHSTAHTLFERMAPGSASTLDWYKAKLTCTGNVFGVAMTGLPNGAHYNNASGYVLPPLPPGASVNCTLTNEPSEVLVPAELFRDDGQGIPGPSLTGPPVANNGAMEGWELSLPFGSAALRMTDCAVPPTVLATTSSVSYGNVVMRGIYLSPNSPLCIELDSPGMISTGVAPYPSGVLPAGYTYTRAPIANGVGARLQLQWQGQLLPNLKWGFVPPNVFFPDSNLRAGANSTVLYAHRFGAGTTGTVTYAVTGAASSGSAAWANTTKVYDDVNCDGMLDAGEAQLYPAAGAGKAVRQGQTCIVVSQFVPANAADGDVYTATVEATFDYANASPAMSTQHTLQEVTTVALAGVGKAFSSSSILAGQTSDLVFSLTNSSPGALQNGLGFTDTLPAGLVLASGAPVVSNTCGGTVTATPGAGAVTLSGGAMTAATPSCTLTVRVTSSSPPVIGECSPSQPAALTNKASNVTVVGPRNDIVDACLAVHPVGISGGIFLDNGVGGTANNGIRDGGEAPIAGVQMRLTNCAATVYTSGISDGTGHYALNGAAVPINTTVCVEQTNLASHVSTGASLAGAVLPAGYTYVRPATRSGSPDRVALQWLGSAIAGLDFGDVMDSAFAANGQQEGLPGSTVNYAHTFIAATAGKVTFSVTNSRPDWAVTVFADPLCTGTPQAGAAQLFPPLGVGSSVMAGDKVCIAVRQFIPATATLGESHAVSINARFDFANNPALPAVGYTLTDQIMVGAAALSLKKDVRNVTVSGPFGVNNQAKPGDELEYRIVYTNNAPGVITDLAISDTTPAYTTFVSSTAGTTPTALGACSKNTPANPRPAPPVDCTTGPAQPVGGTGALHWVFGGGLEAGASGEVLFRVKVD
ncbi:MAG: hypothetical protein QM639_11975 [Rhodocyclaceae bacterium]